MTTMGNHKSEDEGLEVLFPAAPGSVTVADRVVAVPSLKVRQYAAFQKAVAPIMGFVMAGRYLEAITHQTAASCETVMAATGVEEDWLGDLGPDQLMHLLAAVCEVQIDFFVRRLQTTQNELGDRWWARLLALGGAQPSPGSSGADTALPNAES